MKLQKPESIKNNPFKSQKWDEITEGRNFSNSDVPILKLLIQWYAVIDKCEQDLEMQGDIQVAYQNEMGDIKALPQLATMKQASAEIRAINKQLGINDSVEPKKAGKTASFSVVQSMRKKRYDKSRTAKGRVATS